MKINGFVKKGEYFDSVSIMLVAKKVSAMPGVLDSAVVMGTNENKSLIVASGLAFPSLDSAGEMDLLIVFKTDAGIDEKSITSEIEKLLKVGKESNQEDDVNPGSIEEAMKVMPDSNLAMISVAGRYAGDVAKKALDNGLHVMLFSDNIPIETEIALKKYALEKGLLVMGPDCGTAIIQGVPLAFANVVHRGNIGIVAASGTGCQEVTCLISNNGGGISQAIGTGGRDVKKEVGGMMFLEGLKALLSDPETKVILLVAKPPDREVIEQVTTLTNKSEKPVVGIFLGSPVDLLNGSKILPAATLEEGALFAVALAMGQSVTAERQNLKSREAELNVIAKKLGQFLQPGQKYLRALFSGGTFCDEAQLLCRDMLTDLYSNTPVQNVNKLADAWKSVKNTIVDLGDDEFTVGKPHPMIDYSIRNQRILAEARDPETAILLLDIVLGYGSNMTPLADFIPVLNEVNAIAVETRRTIPIIVSVTGTDKDPQGRAGIVNALQEAGATVFESNAAACKVARDIVLR
jgi:succinyl-CoA synthetase alpha subunit